jgi:hypothetical protein
MTGIPQYYAMHPTQVREPFHREGWVYEEKVDGWRILAYKDGTRVRLLSRNGVDHARRFLAVAAAVAALRDETLVLTEKWPSSTRLCGRGLTCCANPIRVSSRPHRST